MSVGYSARFAALMKAQHKKHKKNIVFELGHLCVKYEVPAMEAAEYLSISRQVFYKWMHGDYQPTPEHIDKITRLVKLLKDHYGKK